MALMGLCFLEHLGPHGHRRVDFILKQQQVVLVVLDTTPIEDVTEKVQELWQHRSYHHLAASLLLITVGCCCLSECLSAPLFLIPSPSLFLLQST